jgi:hypothetical protein
MADAVMVPGQFYPAQFDLSTAAEQMRAMREQAAAAAEQVRRTASGLKQGVSGALAPVADISALAVQHQAQAQSLAHESLVAQSAAATQWQTMLEPVSGGFENVTRAALAGTGHMGQAWRAMGRDMVASLVRTHAEALLFGGERGSLLSGVFGAREAGGGLSGLAGGLLFGQTYDAGAIGRVLGLTPSPAAASELPQDLSGLDAAARGLPDTFNAVASSAARLPGTFSTLGDTLSGVLGEAGTGGGGLFGSLLGGFGGIGGILGFARGGIVPSAAGGMLVGPGHGTLAMLHPREMVLPAHLSEGVQRMVSGAGVGPTAGHNVNVNYHVNALDARSVRSLLMEHGDTIVNVLQRALRDSPRGGVGFQVT